MKLELVQNNFHKIFIFIFSWLFYAMFSLIFADFFSIKDYKLDEIKQFNCQDPYIIADHMQHIIYCDTPAAVKLFYFDLIDNQIVIRNVIQFQYADFSVEKLRITRISDETLILYGDKITTDLDLQKYQRKDLLIILVDRNGKMIESRIIHRMANIIPVNFQNKIYLWGNYLKLMKKSELKQTKTDYIMALQKNDEEAYSSESYMPLEKGLTGWRGPGMFMLLNNREFIAKITDKEDVDGSISFIKFNVADPKQSKKIFSLKNKIFLDGMRMRGNILQQKLLSDFCVSLQDKNKILCDMTGDFLIKTENSRRLNITKTIYAIIDLRDSTTHMILDERFNNCRLGVNAEDTDNIYFMCTPGSPLDRFADLHHGIFFLRKARIK